MYTVAMQKLAKADQAELTKSKLIAVGKRYFTKYGYAHTASEDIVAAAQVTRGALYHHFDGKEGLFLAVLIEMQISIQHTIETDIRKITNSFEKLQQFCHSYLTALNQPDVLQISLIDAQTVIGWHKWNELNEQYSLHLLMEIIDELVSTNTIKPYTVASLTTLLAGSIHQTVLWSVGQKHPDIALAEATAALDEMLLSLRVENWVEAQ